MEVTAKSKDGKELYRTERHYHTQATTCKDEKMAYGAQNKTSYVRDTTLQPYQTKAETFEIVLPFETKDGVNVPSVRAVDLTVELNYEIQSPDNKIQIHKVTREVSLDR